VVRCAFVYRRFMMKPRPFVVFISWLALVHAASPMAQRLQVTEPLLPSDNKECTAMNDDFSAAQSAALQRSFACARRNGGVRLDYTNSACLQDLSESIRTSMAFTC